MIPGDRVEMSRHELDTIAWNFLGSEFTGQVYAGWPMDRRVDAYLRHHGLIEVVHDGGTYDALLVRVMANVGRALRNGVITHEERAEDPTGETK